MFLAGIAFGIKLFLDRPTARSLTEIRVPGKTIATLEQSGPYNLYHNWMWKDAPRALRIKISSVQSGKEQSVRDLSASPESSWREPDRYKKFGEFTVDEPGRYEVTTEYNGDNRQSASIHLGLSYNPDFLLPLMISIGGIVSIILGLVIASAILKARTRAAEALGDRLVYAAKGIRVYNQVIFLKEKFSATELHQSQINYVEQTSTYVKGSKAGMSHVDQGIKINYNQGGRERERIFWSDDRPKLYQAIKGAGYRTRLSAP